MALVCAVRDTRIGDVHSHDLRLGTDLCICTLHNQDCLWVRPCNNHIDDGDDSSNNNHSSANNNYSNTNTNSCSSEIYEI